MIPRKLVFTGLNVNRVIHHWITRKTPGNATDKREYCNLLPDAIPYGDGPSDAD